MRESWKKALDLERFINSYVPKGWDKPIGNVYPYPYLLSTEYEVIESGGLNRLPERFKLPAHREAIEAFFKMNAGPEGVKISH